MEAFVNFVVTIQILLYFGTNRDQNFALRKRYLKYEAFRDTITSSGRIKT